MEKNMLLNCVNTGARVRFARNIKGYPFPHKMSIEQKNEVIMRVKTALFGTNSYISELFDFIEIKSLSEMELISLYELNLLSYQFINDTNGKALILSKDKKTSVMINEEDHLRIQSYSNQINEAFDMADKIEIILGESLQMAYDEKLGYLTNCPTNLGTGMRASVMLHLPALHENNAISRIAASLSKLGFTIRGSHGEGSSAKGHLFQISNQVTLGLSETEAIENLQNITVQIISQELSYRAKENYEDKVARALGVLKYARTISSQEATELLSLIRVGICTDLIKDISANAINDIYKGVSPATLILNLKLSNHELRDKVRADYLREKFKKVDFIS